MFRLVLATLLLATVLPGTTLQQLSIDEMSAKATEVVRGKVNACTPARQGKLIVTRCSVDVTERWKGGGGKTVQVTIPGGMLGNTRHTIAGVPSLRPGDEHIFFLWTGRSGITQLLGLGQGVLGVAEGENGEWFAVRGPAGGRMVDRAGKRVADPGIDIRIRDLRETVERKAGR